MSLEEYLAKKLKKYLIFDLDGTLFKVMIDWDIFRKQLEEMLQSFDPNLAEENNLFMPDGLDRTLSAGVKKYGNKIYNKVIDLQARFEIESTQKLVPNNELIEFIKRHGSKYYLSIWSNNCRPIIDKALNQEKILDKFKTFASRETYKLSKPEPDGFDVIFGQHQEKKDYLFIGNSDNDAIVAKTVGIDFYRVSMEK